MGIGPFSVGYPVNFTSGGDTTKDAFWKHIQEIKKIYGILNALDEALISAGDISSAISGELQKHINSTNPHPNWEPSLSFSDITGYISADQIRDNSIPAGKISGLSALIGGQIPPDKGDGLISTSIKEDGYAEFNNGLILQWGNGTFGPISEQSYGIVFAKKFPNKCLNVSLTLYSSKESAVLSVTPQLISEKITTESFYFYLQYFWNTVDEIWSYDGDLGISWQAIGY